MRLLEAFAAIRLVKLSRYFEGSALLVRAVNRSMAQLTVLPPPPPTQHAATSPPRNTLPRPLLVVALHIPCTYPAHALHMLSTCSPHTLPVPSTQHTVTSPIPSASPRCSAWPFLTWTSLPNTDLPNLAGPPLHAAHHGVRILMHAI